MAKLQVGLLGSARQIQLDLERIAGKADTRSSSGLHYILQGAPVLNCAGHWWGWGEKICRK